MNDEVEKKLLADSISTPIIKGYQVGGMALALVLVGTILLVSAVLSEPSLPSYVTAFVGASVIVAILARFYFVDIKNVKKVTTTIKDNEELLNSIQDTAIQMTELSSHLQALAFKHADKIGPVITQFRDAAKLVTDIPIIGGTDIGKNVLTLVEHQKVKDAQQFSSDIVEYTESAKEVIENVRLSLIQLDPEPLKRYKKIIQELDNRLQNLLKNTA